jgi:hypothetical protein
VSLSDGIALTDVVSDGITEAAGGAGDAVAAGAAAGVALAGAVVPPPGLELALEHPAASMATSTTEGAIARVKTVTVHPVLSGICHLRRAKPTTGCPGITPDSTTAYGYPLDHPG